jgi:hypothetical protein
MVYTMVLPKAYSVRCFPALSGISQYSLVTRKYWTFSSVFWFFPVFSGC